jgi:hypothetical protein
MLFDVAVAGLAHPEDEVRIHVMMSLSDNAAGVKAGLSVPAFIPLTCH